MSDNELIAEFMGGEKIDLVSKFGEGWAKIIQLHAPEATEFPPYDKSWDWLMPVVERCKNAQRGKYHDRTRVLYVDVCLALEEVNIQKAHAAVVRFIEWFNENGKK